MIQWIKKINRSRNHHFKIYKFKLRLKLICILSHRYTIRQKNTPHKKQVVIPFIGKGIGDAIVFSGLIEILKNNNYQITVVSDSKSYFLFKEWNIIDNLFLYDTKEKSTTIQKLKKLGPFIFIDPHEITRSSIDTFNIIRHSKPIISIGFNNNFSVYDHIIEMSQPNGHISNKGIDVLDFLGIETAIYNYIVHIPDKNIKEAGDLIKTVNGKKIIVFNPFGGVNERFLSKDQITSILDYLSQFAEEFHVIIIGEQEKIKDIQERNNVTKNPHTSFLTAAQLIKESQLVITPDTSIVHLSRAFNKRMVCFYPFKMLSDKLNNADVWGPNYDAALQVRLTETCLADADINLILDHIGSEMRKLRT
ncbi:glycosyltransferase family 9 protein [Enterobacter cloacae]|uniref:glycosyltransferase family 9 protein n=1 Tax=Enterobacter cloacae TaxID=550 RepID=UPI002FF8EB13